MIIINIIMYHDNRMHCVVIVQNDKTDYGNDNHCDYASKHSVLWQNLLSLKSGNKVLQL